MIYDPRLQCRNYRYYKSVRVWVIIHFFNDTTRIRTSLSNIEPTSSVAGSINANEYQLQPLNSN